jgi:hypothetical protein
MNIAAQPVQLGNRNRALASAGVRERSGKLWSPVEGVGTFTRLNLSVLANDVKAFRSGETSKGLSLSFQAQPGSALSCR